MVEVGTMSRNIHPFTAQSQLIEKLSQSISEQLQDAIDTHGKASLIVSGGSTPKPLFEKLRLSNIEWEKVSIGLCDERWVSPSDDDSNEKLVKTHLLQDRASKAKFVGMFIDNVQAENAELECTKKIKETLFPFTVVILGMGGDAHTASLFPNNKKLKEAYDLENEELCISIEPQTAPHMRMSLTRSAILSAKHLYLHFEGKKKLAVYNEALNSKDMYQTPISAILNQDILDVEVYYYE